MENDQNYFDTEVFEAKHMKKTILRFIRLYGEAEMETDRCIYLYCLLYLFYGHGALYTVQMW